MAGEAFGNDRPNEDPDGDDVAFVLDMRYPGQQYDSASGLNYNYFRDYEAATARYVESDPIGLAGGISTYGYVSGNSLIFADPSGLQSCAHPVNAAACAAVTTEMGGGTAATGAAGAGAAGAGTAGTGTAVAGAGLSGWSRLVNDLRGLGSAFGALYDEICDDDNKEECEALNRVDTDTCNAITRRRGGRAGAACHASASQRYAACLRGAPIPPLNTWNN